MVEFGSCPAAFAARAINVLVAACDATYASIRCKQNAAAGSINPCSSSSTTTTTTTNAVKDEVKQPPKAPPQPEQAPAPTPVAKSVTANTSRDRMKQEILRLRDTAAELQHQLDELKRERTRMRSSPTGPSHQQQEPTPNQRASAWEALARGQCEQRHRAEVENAKLRKSVDEQRKLAHTVERLLTKRCHTPCAWNGDTNNSNNKRARSSSSCTTGRSGSPIDAPHVFMNLKAALPPLYDQIDTVLLRTSSSLKSNESPLRQVDVRHDDALGCSYIEATERRILPFSVSDTCEAVWDSFIQYPQMPAITRGSTQQQQQYQYQYDKRTADSIERELVLRIQLVQFTGHARIKYAVQRFTQEKDQRVVIVWVAIMDPRDVLELLPVLGDGEGGVVIRHTGWMCIQPSPVAATEELEDRVVTEFHTAQLSMPEFFGGANKQKKKKCMQAASLTNFMASSIDSQLDRSKQFIDNWLLERTMSRRQ